MKNAKKLYKHLREKIFLTSLHVKLSLNHSTNEETVFIYSGDKFLFTSTETELINEVMQDYNTFYDSVYYVLKLNPEKQRMEFVFRSIKAEKRP